MDTLIIFKMAEFLSFLQNFIIYFEKMEVIVNLHYLKRTDTRFTKTIVYEDLQYGGNQKSVALLVEDLFDAVTASEISLPPFRN